MAGEDPAVSAQVVLRRTNGDGQSAARVVSGFRQLGFETGPLVGTSFAITASRSRVEEVFGTALVGDGRGSWRPIRGEGYELPLEGLPERLRTLVEAVTFTPPPDFGPTSW